MRTTYSFRKRQQELGSLNLNLSPSLKTLVRTKIFSNAFEFGDLAEYMRIGLYQEWLELQQINRSLLAAR